MKPTIVRDYKVRIVPPVVEKFELRETETQAWLDVQAALGFRLIRAEADGHGVMWLVMERAVEEST